MLNKLVAVEECNPSAPDAAQHKLPSSNEDDYIKLFLTDVT